MDVFVDVCGCVELYDEGWDGDTSCVGELIWECVPWEVGEEFS